MGNVPTYLQQETAENKSHLDSLLGGAKRRTHLNPHKYIRNSAGIYLFLKKREHCPTNECAQYLAPPNLYLRYLGVIADVVAVADDVQPAYAVPVDAETLHGLFLGGLLVQNDRRPGVVDGALHVDGEVLVREEAVKEGEIEGIYII